MSVYTPVSVAELETFLHQYPAGALTEYAGISAGVENSNFFVTTTTGAYVLTLFEHHTPEELGYFLSLMQHWANAGIPVARPLANHAGHLLGSLNGKPAALVTRLPGSHLEQPSIQQCAAMGAMLARMHLAGRDFPQKRTPDRGHEWRMQTAEKLLAQLSPSPQPLSLKGRGAKKEVLAPPRPLREKGLGGEGFPDAALLRAEMAFQQTIPFAQLPAGTLHADLFRDNVLFQQEHLSGILDVYFACHDSWLYDLAIVVNDWCCHADGSVDTPRLQACINAYQTVRHWESIEQRYWPAVLRAAALRFWLSRLAAKLNPRDGEMILQKDPDEFRDKLLQRITEDNTVMQAITLDARRLLCPMPVIRVQQAVENLPAGVTVTAICTDPGALHDIPAWARIHGHTVLETRSEGREHIIVLQTGTQQ